MALINKINNNLTIAFCLFIGGLITRIPYASQMIFSGDSARFAFALKDYDVAQMRPHAPGYVLYVGLAKLVDFFVQDPCASMVGVSIVANAATIGILFLLATKMYGRISGSMSAFFILSLLNLLLMAYFQTH